VTNGRCILLTPPGGAAIAVIRLVGDGVPDFVAAHFSKPVHAGRCMHGNLSDGDRVLDDAVVVISDSGRVADLNLHGGPWVVRSVIDLARRRGFSIEENASLPLPGVALDAETELSREVLQYLPMATTELAVRALLAQESAWQSWKQSTVTSDGVAAALADQSMHWLLHPPRIAIVGVPNVGKSTIANQLFAQERVITADEPGTTRDWVGELANLDGLAVTLIDTPGSRETTDLIEREAIARSREQVIAASLVVLVLDPTQPRAPEQEALERAHPHALRVVNKADRAAIWHGDGPALYTVATTGTGVDLLRATIRRHFLGPDPFDLTRPRPWTDRQREILRRVLAGRGTISEL
jgi:small GTP-binding protein